MSIDLFEIETNSSDETRQAGFKLASWLRAGDVVLLHGDLGAGKTTLAQGIATGLGIDGHISSPSFLLINEYEVAIAAVPGRLFHVDLYRLRDEADLESIGYAEIVAPLDSVTLVEWPERARELLPDAYLLVEFALGSADQRKLRFSLRSSAPGATQRLAQLKTVLPGSS
jgi:tRNA threonylcarbamoyladenosine biosynthesis protein TsaE